jgi:hypothetical protein
MEDEGGAHHAVQKKDLQRRDPGNGARIMVLQQLILVVLLKDANA